MCPCIRPLSFLLTSTRTRTARTRHPNQHPQDPELFELLAAAAIPAAPTASPHSISDLAWAFATAGHPAPELFAALTRAAAGKLNDRFSLGMLTDMLW